MQTHTATHRPASSALAFALASSTLLGACGNNADEPLRPRDELAQRPDEQPVTAIGLIRSSAPDQQVTAQAIAYDGARRIAFERWDVSKSERVGQSKPRLVMVRQSIDNERTGDGQPREAWVLERYIAQPGGPDDHGAPGRIIRKQRLVATEGGGLALSEEYNFQEKVKVEFDPPMWVMPAALPTGGEECVFERVTMTVRPLDDLSKIKARGSATHSVCYEGEDLLFTPAGEFTAHRLVSRLKADLSGANVSNTTTQWFVDDVGIVAERRREETRTLGIPVRNNHEAWIAERIDR